MFSKLKNFFRPKEEEKPQIKKFNSKEEWIAFKNAKKSEPEIAKREQPEVLKRKNLENTRYQLFTNLREWQNRCLNDSFENSLKNFQEKNNAEKKAFMLKADINNYQNLEKEVLQGKQASIALTQELEKYKNKISIFLENLNNPKIEAKLNYREEQKLEIKTTDIFYKLNDVLRKKEDNEETKILLEQTDETIKEWEFLASSNHGSRVKAENFQNQLKSIKTEIVEKIYVQNHAKEIYQNFKEKIEAFKQKQELYEQQLKSIETNLEKADTDENISLENLINITVLSAHQIKETLQNITTLAEELEKNHFPKNFNSSYIELKKETTGLVNKFKEQNKKINTAKSNIEIELLYVPISKERKELTTSKESESLLLVEKLIEKAEKEKINSFYIKKLLDETKGNIDSKLDKSMKNLTSAINISEKIYGYGIEERKDAQFSKKHVEIMDGIISELCELSEKHNNQRIRLNKILSKNDTSKTNEKTSLNEIFAFESIEYEKPAQAVLLSLDHGSEAKNYYEQSLEEAKNGQDIVPIPIIFGIEQSASLDIILQRSGFKTFGLLKNKEALEAISKIISKLHPNFELNNGFKDDFFFADLKEIKEELNRIYPGIKDINQQYLIDWDLETEDIENEIIIQKHYNPEYLTIIFSLLSKTGQRLNEISKLNTNINSWPQIANKQIGEFIETLRTKYLNLKKKYEDHLVEIKTKNPNLFFGFPSPFHTVKLGSKLNDEEIIQPISNKQPEKELTGIVEKTTCDSVIEPTETDHEFEDLLENLLKNIDFEEEDLLKEEGLMEIAEMMTKDPKIESTEIADYEFKDLLEDIDFEDEDFFKGENLMEIAEMMTKDLNIVGDYEFEDLLKNIDFEEKQEPEPTENCETMHPVIDINFENQELLDLKRELREKKHQFNPIKSISSFLNKYI